jgi:hypothetical protein
MPLGIDHKIPVLGRETSRLIAMDMPRLCDTLITHNRSYEKDHFDFVYANARFDMARLLHDHYGFRIHSIYEDAHVIKTFNRWETLLEHETVTAILFATPDDLLLRIWDNANNVLEKVVKSAKISNKSRYMQFEIALRKLAIAVRNTQSEITDSVEIGQWWKIYQPRFEQK